MSKSYPDKIVPFEYQDYVAEIGYQILKDNVILYLAMEERTGKSLPAILIAERTNNTQRILIVTKKGKPLNGWNELLKGYSYATHKEYTVINYHQLKNVQGEFDLIILDEAHNYISGYPKKSQMWNVVRRYTKGKPIIYVSATPYAQTPSLLYHQFALSDWSPWKNYSTFYSWHQRFGTGETKYVHNREVKCYDKVKDKEVIATCDHLFIAKTRKELGFKHEPKDKLHYIELSEKTKALYNELLENKVIDEPVFYMADTVTLLRFGLHQLEGGTLKASNFMGFSNSPTVVKKEAKTIKDEEGKVQGTKFTEYHDLSSNEKIDFIKDNWGDSSDLAIMYNYIAEGFKLEKHFKHAKILQATSNAEGVDLSHIDNLVIYSQDFSTARHTQRRARQANKHRQKPIIVHYLLVENGVSAQVYKTVTINKVNYVDSLFERRKLK